MLCARFLISVRRFCIRVVCGLVKVISFLATLVKIQLDYFFVVKNIVYGIYFDDIDHFFWKFYLLFNHWFLIVYEGNHICTIVVA